MLSLDLVPESWARRKWLPTPSAAHVVPSAGFSLRRAASTLALNLHRRGDEGGANKSPGNAGAAEAQAITKE